MMTGRRSDSHLRALAAAAGQLDVLGEDGDELGVDSAEVGALEEAHEVEASCSVRCRRGIAAGLCPRPAQF